LEEEGVVQEPCALPEVAEDCPKVDLFDVLPPLELREVHRMCFFQGRMGPWLYIGRRVGSDTTGQSMGDLFEIVSPEDGERRVVDAETLLSELGISECERLVDATKVAQLVFVVVDSSESMQDCFESESRFDAVQKFLGTFVHSAAANHARALFGLISFSGQIVIRRDLTPLARSFEDALREIVPTGATQCFGAILRAAEKLVTAQPKYPNAVLRIFVISDGVDNRTRPPQTAALPNFLIQKQVRVDAMIVSDDIEKGLPQLAQWTGGVTFKPSSLEQGIALMEQEAFYNLAIRKFGSFRMTPVPKDWLANCPEVQEQYIAREVPFMRKREKALVPAEEWLSRPRRSAPGPRESRIIEELRHIVAQRNPNVRVFVTNRFDSLQLYLKGPVGSPYQGRWWLLSLDFPKQYPATPPLVAFCEPIWHMNIGKEGRLGPWLDAWYRLNTRVYDLILAIEDLLTHPKYDQPATKAHKQIWDLQPTVFSQKLQETVNANRRTTIDPDG
jgi:ubiquitin-protein ligase